MINDTLFGIVIVNRSDMAAKARQSGKTRRIAATIIFSPDSNSHLPNTDRLTAFRS
ncbi:hypothetical protein [Rhizobium leguminosarum]|uniref:hypothetical protein n=1 Tax=Rhizobium leguminosarum TaxID=384 RepID=UPI0028F4504E|nr:hypothetical protein [Rhizobium leguminosarum]